MTEPTQPDPSPIELGGRPRKPSLFKRRWVQVTGAGLLGLVIGSAGGAGSTTTTTGASPTATSAAPDNGQEVEGLRQQLSEALNKLKSEQTQHQQIAAELREERKKTLAAASAAAAAPSDSDANGTDTSGTDTSSGELADGSFTSTKPRLKNDGLGDFGGTARVTNTSGSEVTGSFTYTLYKNGKELGTASGVANEVGAGKTATVQLVSQDKYVAGVDRVEFQVDAEF